MDGKLLRIDDLLTDPDFYLFLITLEQKYGEEEKRLMLKFRRMSEAKFKAEPHLDDNFSPLEDLEYSMPFERMLNRFEEVKPPSPPTHYIFHHGFCGSTLFSRAMEAMGGFFVVREPLALTLWSRPRRHLRGNDDVWRRGLKMITYLLARNYQQGEASVLKLNDDNNVITDLLTGDTRSKGIFIYSDLEDFIVSVLAGEEKRSEFLSRTAFVRRRTHRFSEDSELLKNYMDDLDLDGLTVVQATTLVWLVQRYTYFEHAAKVGKQKLRSLNSSDLLTKTPEVLLAAADFFGRPASGDRALAVSRSETMQKHAKHGEKYDSEAHRARRKADHARFRREIEEGLGWAETIQKRFPLSGPGMFDLLGD